MPFFLKVVLMYLGLYFVALMATFVGEVSYKKRSIHQVRQDWKRIAFESSAVFCVFVIATIVWKVMGKTGE